MRLRTLRLHGFRRFERAKLTIDGPVLAIIGPNEAGKTSILEALRRLNAGDPIEATSLTFGVPPKADVIDARFWLEDADRAVLGPAGSKARWLIVTKTRKGPRRYELEPPVPRPLGPRHTAQARVAEVIASPTFAKWPGQVQQPLRLLASGLQSEEEDIPSETEARVSSVITEIGNFVRRPANAKHGVLGDLRQINKVLTGLREHEAGSWNRREGAKLAGRVPTFELFDENRRVLASSYDLSKGEGAQPPQINEALKNLLRLGGISPKELRDAISTGAQGPVDTLTEKARKNLETALRSWTQRDGERGGGRSIAEGLTVKLSVREKTILNALDRLSSPRPRPRRSCRRPRIRVP